MFFLLTLVLLMAGIAAHQLGFVHGRRRLARRSFEDILGSVERVDFQALHSIADCYLRPDAGQLRLEPPVMWELVGGDEGVKRLSSNAALMLELAVVAEQWNQVEGAVIAEMLRRDAMRIRSAVRQIRFGLLWSGGSVSAAFHLQEAVSSYCLMHARLLGLYQNAHIALVPRLEAAL